MTDIQTQITAFWDTVAPAYDCPDNVASPGTPGYDHWTEALRFLLPVPPTRVVDVGAGTGFLARIAAELGHRVIGIDLSHLPHALIGCRPSGTETAGRRRQQ
jgi:2-polyprenyl-3-methyl-5-hydroxy-6-metoxy-1,4-benzoquinol methylase